jgi:hypothetical protein
MRLALLIALAVGKMLLVTDDEYLKNGELTQPLRILQLQGGFAGFTGMEYSVARDGSWTSESVFREKRTPKDKGKLSGKDLAKLAAILETHGFGKLPEKSGVQPGANPHTILLEYGTRKVNWIGQVRPKVDRENPEGTVDSRIAGIVDGVIGLLTPRPANAVD